MCVWEVQVQPKQCRGCDCKLIMLIDSRLIVKLFEMSTWYSDSGSQVLGIVPFK